MKKHVCVLAFLFVCMFDQHLLGQAIVNIENKRIVTDTIGWAGNADLEFRISKNLVTEYAFSSDLSLQYKSEKSLYLVLGNLSSVEAGDQRFVDSGFGHLRYNRKMGSVLRLETFGQVQYNDILKVRKRILVGGGPRLKLVSTDRLAIYHGPLYMYEINDERDPDVIDYDHRMSAYVSATFNPWDQVRLVTTWYYQPLLEDFNDYRVSGQAVLKIKLAQYLDFKTTFTFLHDHDPAVNIPRSVYAMSNGFSINFGEIGAD